MRDIVRIKKPEILHIADKHFGVTHEHLPIGKGEIDFDLIFREVLPDFEGKIIFEVVDEDFEITNSKQIIYRIINK